MLVLLRGFLYLIFVVGLVEFDETLIILELSLRFNVIKMQNEISKFGYLIRILQSLQILEELHHLIFLLSELTELLI